MAREIKKTGEGITGEKSGDESSLTSNIWIRVIRLGNFLKDEKQYQFCCRRCKGKGSKEPKRISRRRFRVCRRLSPLAGSLGHPWLMSLYIATNRLRTTGDECWDGQQANLVIPSFLAAKRERETEYIRCEHGNLTIPFDPLLMTHSIALMYYYVKISSQLLSLSLSLSLQFQSYTNTYILRFIKQTRVCICFYWSYAWLIPKSRWVSRWIQTASPIQVIRIICYIYWQIRWIYSFYLFFSGGWRGWVSLCNIITLTMCCLYAFI